MCGIKNPIRLQWHKIITVSYVSCVLIAWIFSFFYQITGCWYANANQSRARFWEFGRGRISIEWSTASLISGSADYDWKFLANLPFLQRAGCSLPNIGLHWDNGTLEFPFWFLLSFAFLGMFFLRRLRVRCSRPFVPGSALFYGIPFIIMFCLWIISFQYALFCNNNHSYLEIKDGIITGQFNTDLFDNKQQAGWGIQVGKAEGRLGLVGFSFRVYEFREMTSCFVIVPFWLICLTLLAMATLSWFRHRRWMPKDGCQKCGYLLIANTSGICPECGTPIALNSNVSHAR